MAKAAKKTRNGKGTGARKTSTRRPRGTGGSFVYDSLKSKILNLELKPGTLLDETELSRSFKLSRSPVREALIRLSAEGLVEERITLLETQIDDMPPEWYEYVIGRLLATGALDAQGDLAAVSDKNFFKHDGSLSRSRTAAGRIRRPGRSGPAPG